MGSLAMVTSAPSLPSAPRWYIPQREIRKNGASDLNRPPGWVLTFMPLQDLFFSFPPQPPQPPSGVDSRVIGLNKELNCSRTDCAAGQMLWMELRANVKRGVSVP